MTEKYTKLLGLEYQVWHTNPFDDNILTDFVALFKTLELAKDFVEYQATLGEGYAIVFNGERIDL